MRRAVIGQTLRSGNRSRIHYMRVRRVWPFHSLQVGDFLDVEEPRRWHSAKQSAYQYGKRAGKRFSVQKVAVARSAYGDARDLVLRIERIA